MLIASCTPTILIVLPLETGLSVAESDERKQPGDEQVSSPAHLPGLTVALGDSRIDTRVY